MSRIELGPFQLLAPLGEGGMGEIWRAVHPPTGVPVAVKLLRSDRLATHHDELEREVRAQASLNHPGIVALFDFGTVAHDAARASGGRITAGSPYVAMELADGGSLREHMPLGSWADVRRVVSSVLPALSRAHARGVIHRDIKPENILMFGEPPYTPKLADFGIAHRQSREHDSVPRDLESFAGTPHYVAPEQALGQWRMFGPWTDIYTVGCLVWELVCGAPPYEGPWLDIVSKHIAGEQTAFRPRVEVPPALREWLSFAMARAPLSRFRTCADALASLPGDLAAGGANRPSPRAPESTAMAPTPKDLAADTPTELMPPMQPLAGPAAAADQRRAPVSKAVPADWRGSAERRDLRLLSGAGLGLLELREPQFVGRESERDLLWEQLRQVGEGGLRVVFVVGGPGVGKSALARWLATRADEVGAARQLIALNTSDAPGPAHGFAGLLRRNFHAWNLAGDDLHKHIVPQITLGDREARLLAGWLGSGEGAGDYPYPSPAARNDIAHRLLVAFTQSRPAVAWLDDLQWSGELVETLEYILNARPEPNALVVCTVRADVLAERAETARRLAPLFEHRASVRIDLEPLPAADEQALVREFLPVDDEMATRIAQRAEGNPLFARQLLKWLVDDESGDIEHALPNTIQELFEQRLGNMIGSNADDPEEVWRCLECAAVLGRQVERSEWTLAHGGGEELTKRIESALALRGLARETPTGFEFEHSFLVDSLEQRAARNGRLEQHHENCAQALKQSPNGSLETRVREMEHWAKAEAWEQAIELSEAVTNPLARRGNMNAVRQMVRRRLEWLELAGYGASDLRRLEALLKLGILTTTGADEGPARARELASEVLEHARAGQHDDLEMQALELLAMVAERSGLFDESLERAQEALAAVQRLQKPRAECIARIRFGWALLHTGQLTRADESFAAAVAYAESHDEPYLRCYARVGQIWLELAREQFELAKDMTDELVEAAHDNGWSILETYGKCHRASRHLICGEHERAFEVASAASEALETIDSSSEDVLVRSLEALSLACLERFDEAFACLVELRQLFMNRGLPNESGIVAVVEIAVASGRGDRDAFDAAAQWLSSERGKRAVVRPEHPTVLDWAAAQWAGDAARSELAHSIAREMRRRLGA